MALYGPVQVIRCVSTLANDRLAQCINYLKTTGLTLGLMINFQKPNSNGGEFP